MNPFGHPEPGKGPEQVGEEGGKREERHEGDPADYPARDEKAVDEAVPMAGKLESERSGRSTCSLPGEEKLNQNEHCHDEEGSENLNRSLLAERPREKTEGKA